MFISRFNRYFEKHGRLTYGLLGALISVMFVLFMSPGKGGCTGPRRQTADVGTMYGEKIDPQAFYQAMQEADVANYLERMRFLSEDGNLSRALVGEGLKRIRALHEAEHRGLGRISDDEVRLAIRSMPVFGGADNFDSERFLAFQTGVLARRGMAGSDFDAFVRRNIMIERLEAQAAAAAYVSPVEVREMFDRYYEEVTLQYHAFVLERDTDDVGQPSDEEVQAYFEAHREEIRLPDEKKVRVATFAPRQFLGQAEVTDDEVATHYNTFKNRSYKDKSLDDVRGQIMSSLKLSKARSLAQDAAKGLIAALKADAPEGDTPAALAERFSALSAERDIPVKDSDLFTSESKGVPGVGTFPRLQRQVYGLSEEVPLSDDVYEAGSFFVGCWLETVPGGTPDEVSDGVREDIVDRILSAEAKTIYTEKIEPYRSDINAGLEPGDLTNQERERLAAGTLEAQEQAEALDAYRRTIMTYLQPYYVPTQKRARLVRLHPSDYLGGIEITEAQIASYYERNKADYSKPEVRASQIVAMVAPGATEDEKAEKRAKLERLLEQMREGATFEDLARQHSEDAATRMRSGDLGWFGRNSKPKPIETAAFDMAAGEISDVIETPKSLVILKLAGRRDGRPLEEVSGEIKAELLTEESVARCVDAVADIMDVLYRRLDDARSEGGDSVEPSAIFAEVATENDLEVTNTGLFREGGIVSPYPRESALSREAFKLSSGAPFSVPIRGTRDVFLACLTETQPARLPSLEDDPALLGRIKRLALRERGLATLKSKADAAYAGISAALEDGTALTEAAGDLVFTVTDAFPLTRPPADLPDGRTVAAKVRTAPTGKLLEPIEVERGYVLAYVALRTPPTDEKFEKEGGWITSQVQMMKRYSMLDAFYSRLEADSATVLTEEWAPMVAD